MKVDLDTTIVVSGLLQSKEIPQVPTLALAGVIQACHDNRIPAIYAEVLSRWRFMLDEKKSAKC
jgi:hypothetical protein